MLSSIFSYYYHPPSLNVPLPLPPPCSTGHAGTFSAMAEVVEGMLLRLSFFQHLAITRQVANPFERDNVVGITNYVDIGMQVEGGGGGGEQAH